MKAWYELIDYGRTRTEEKSEEEIEQEEILKHVAKCKRDGFCLTCQSL